MKLRATLTLIALAISLPARAQQAGHAAGPERPQPARSSAPASTLFTDPRVVDVRFGVAGFTPSEVHDGACDTTSLRITRETDATCTKEVIVFGRGVQVAAPRALEVEMNIDVDSPVEVRVGCLATTRSACRSWSLWPQGMGDDVATRARCGQALTARSRLGPSGRHDAKGASV